MGYDHEMAGAVKRIVDGESVNESTIATEDVMSAGPDFVSLDSEGQPPHKNEIEMADDETNSPIITPPQSDYAV